MPFSNAPADFMPVGYIAFDRHGTVLDVNRSAAGYWRKSPEEIVHSALQELVAPEYVFPISAFLEALFRSGLKQTCEVQLHTTADNPVRFVQIVGIVDGSEGEKGQKCIAALIDITERRKTEDAFELTRFSINHAVDPVFWVEASGILSYVNDATCRVLGVYREDLLRMRFQEIEHEPGVDNWQDRWLKIKKFGSLVAKSRFRLHSGLILPVELTYNFISFGGKEYLVVHARDLSEQRHVEEALRSSEARYRKLFESISDYVYTVRVQDNQPVSTTHGQGCIHVTGYTPQEYENDQNLWYRMIYEEDRARVLEHSASALSGISGSSIEHRILHKDGSVRWIRNTLVVKKDGHGRVLLYEGIINDITDRKRTELQLLDANKHLEELQRQRDEFLVMISHDLRTPLVTGLGYIDMLALGKFGSLSPEAQKGVNTALKNLRRLQKLIDDILSYQSLSMQSERGGTVMSPCNITELLNECASELIVRTGRDVSSVVVTADNPSLFVSCNQEMIRRVISNLLNNAHKHAGDNASIVLRAHVVDGNKIRIAVRDNGKGINECIRDRIFRSFVKSSDSQGGTGLGLAIVKSIIEVHGSVPELITESGNGTEIAFKLPISAEKPVLTPAPSKLQHQVTKSHKGIKILIVDDDADTIELIEIMLQKLGYAVVSAASGAEALVKIADPSIKMALLDMTLGDMDGAILCEKIKSMEQTNSIPLYMFTARADENSKRKAKTSGCDGYITKPVSMEELFSAIEDALKNHSF